MRAVAEQTQIATTQIEALSPSTLWQLIKLNEELTTLRLLVEVSAGIGHAPGRSILMRALPNPPTSLLCRLQAW